MVLRVLCSGAGGVVGERERRQGMFKGHVERTTGRTTTTMNVFSGTMNPAALRERGCLVGLLEVEELSFRVVAEMGSIHASWKYRWKRLGDIKEEMGDGSRDRCVLLDWIEHEVSNLF